MTQAIKGYPQEGVLSPLLWILVKYLLFQRLDKTLAYADALVASAKLQNGIVYGNWSKYQPI